MDMDYKQIELFLERYWLCETSLEEERMLRYFFIGDDVPVHLLLYKDLFCYQSIQHEQELGEEFDEKIFGAISDPVVFIKPVVDRKWFVPLLRATAIVLSVVFLGNLAQDIFPSQKSEYDYDNYTDTYDNPDIAYQQVSSALLMVSEKINTSKNVTIALPDSIDGVILDEIRE